MPVDFDEHESHYFKANVELMILWLARAHTLTHFARESGTCLCLALHACVDSLDVLASIHWHSLSLGQGGVAGFKCGKQEDKDTESDAFGDGSERP